jgi:hypothetical protein
MTLDSHPRNLRFSLTRIVHGLHSFSFDFLPQISHLRCQNIGTPYGITYYAYIVWLGYSGADIAARLLIIVMTSIDVSGHDSLLQSGCLQKTPRERYGQSSMSGWHPLPRMGVAPYPDWMSNSGIPLSSMMVLVSSPLKTGMKASPCTTSCSMLAGVHPRQPRANSGMPVEW